MLGLFGKYNLRAELLAHSICGGVVLLGAARALGTLSHLMGINIYSEFRKHLTWVVFEKRT